MRVLFFLLWSFSLNAQKVWDEEETLKKEGLLDQDLRSLKFSRGIQNTVFLNDNWFFHPFDKMTDFDDFSLNIASGKLFQKNIYPIFYKQERAYWVDSPSSLSVLSGKEYLKKILREKLPFFFKSRKIRYLLDFETKIKTLKAQGIINKIKGHPLLSKVHYDPYFSVSYHGNIFSTIILDPYQDLNREKYKLLLKVVKHNFRKMTSSWDTKFYSSKICEKMRAFDKKLYPIPDICWFKDLSKQKDYLNKLWNDQKSSILTALGIFKNKNNQMVKRFYHFASDTIPRKIYMKGLSRISLLRRLNTLASNKSSGPNANVAGGGIYVAPEIFSSRNFADGKNPGLYFFDIPLINISNDIFKEILDSVRPFTHNGIYFFDIQVTPNLENREFKEKVKILLVANDRDKKWFKIENVKGTLPIQRFKSKKDLFKMELDRLYEETSAKELPQKIRKHLFPPQFDFSKGLFD